MQLPCPSASRLSSALAMMRHSGDTLLQENFVPNDKDILCVSERHHSSTAASHNVVTHKLKGIFCYRVDAY
jgi:hypothetical protein